MNELNSKLFESLMESSLSGYWDWNIVQNTEFLSVRFKEMFGFSDEEMENSPEAWQKLVFQEDLPLIFEAFGKHVESAGKIPFDSTARYRHKDGSTVWVLCRGKVVDWSPEGAPLRAVGVHIDITHQKCLEEELKNQKEELAYQNAELSNFAHTISHDLQAPLNSIIALTDIAKQTLGESYNADVEELFENIHLSSQRMRSTIKCLLEYSKLGVEKIFEAVDLNAILNELKVDLRSQIELNDVELKVALLPKVYGLGEELRLLFQNLIINAIKYRSENRVCRIEIAVEERANDFLFQIRDNGIGIDTNSLKKIFLLFQRATRRAKENSMGIGLSHCKKIVKLHGGDIWVDSVLGEGSTFYFSLNKRIAS